ncbi:MAG: 7-cyano-7-deazaguanine synthase QueC [Pseudomonadota bacterium]
MPNPKPEKAVVLVSGGLDSATALAWARAEGFACYALSFAYGQRHQAELQAAQRVAQAVGVVEHQVMPLALDVIGGSALTDTTIAVPDYAEKPGIPVTYVPARNTIFLSMALGWAEVLAARHLVIGVNAVDYSGYPDCRPAFIQAFAQLAQLATRAGVERQPVQVHAPLLHLTKAEIIRQGLVYQLDYSLTVSCYQADTEGLACGRCDSCVLRAQGFATAGIADPTHYVT